MTSNNEHHNVLSFQTAISSGFQPRDYSYEKDDIPTGEYYVTPDFMIWAKKLPAIDLYCTVKQIGQRIKLTVFLDKEKSYRLAGTNVAGLSYGSTLAVQVERNTMENPTLNRIKQVLATSNSKAVTRT